MASSGKRWGLGLSALGGVVLGVSLRAARYSGLVVGAAPVGVAVAAGSIALFVDSLRLQKQRKQRTSTPAASQPVAAAAAAAPASDSEPELAPLGAEEQEMPAAAGLDAAAAAAPAQPAAASTSETDALLGAVMEALTAPGKPAAAAVTADDADGTPDEDSATAAAEAAAGPAVGEEEAALQEEQEEALEEDQEDDESPAPALAALTKSASPDLLQPPSTAFAEGANAPAFCDSPTAQSDGDVSPTADSGDVDVVRGVSSDAALPPLGKGKKTATKKLKKSISKSFKKLGKALSMNNSDIVAPATPTAARPPSGNMGSFLRRSFSGDARRASIADSAGDLIDRSEGSQTVKKMKDLLRRSFSLSTPRASMDGGSTKGSSHMVMV